MKTVMTLGVMASIFIATNTWAFAPKDYPSNKPKDYKGPVLEIIQGVKIADPFRWLEDSNNSEVKEWTISQNQTTRKFLDNLPSLQSIQKKLDKWNTQQSPRYYNFSYRGGLFFALKLAPPANQAVLVTLTSLEKDRQETVVLDPNKLNRSGTTAIDFYSPSVDGKTVAVSLSEGGSEIGTLHFYNTKSGESLPDTIPNVTRPTGGGSVAWNKEGTGIFYTRYPSPQERIKEDLDFYQQIYFHEMGKSWTTDMYSLGADFPRIAEISLTTSRNGNHVLAAVANGDGGEYSHYILGSDYQWQQITQFKDKIYGMAMGQNNDLFLLSRKNSPRGKILHLSLTNPKLSQAKTIIKEGEGVISGAIPTKDYLYVGVLEGGPSHYLIYDLKGKPKGEVKTPPVSTSSGLFSTGGNEVYLENESFTRPDTWYRFEGLDKNLSATPIKTDIEFKSPVSFSDIETKRVFVSSKDGTQVPLTLLYKKGLTQNGKAPTLLSGYGGYGISMSPRFKPDNYLWLEQGGILAFANLRGGGEYGEKWHLEGNLTKKQNVFDDFISCAEYLIKEKYTSAQHLAAEGRSNGGLLMGAAFTQRPDLFAAVVSAVGIYDMLRVENDPNGAFNVTEFGTVKKKDQFKALYAYSPYHHVKDGVSYPAVLLLTGANDGRVSPYHSKKMAAQLQKASSSGKPVLLHITFDGGHGMGRSVTQKVKEEADVYAFLFNQLGMTFH